MKLPLRLLLYSTTVSVVFLAGCARAPTPPPMTARPAFGTPRRIVSLTPSNTEVLFALGVGDRVVGVTRYCDYPPEARKKPKVGDANTSLERVVALKPDLVLAHGFLNDSIVRRLRSIGTPVLATDPKTFDEVMSDVGRIGQAVGAQRRAEEIVRSMERTIETVRARSAGRLGMRALVVVQTSPLWVAGPKTFVHEMIGFAGAENIAHDARPGFNTFSVERAIARRPDVIVVTRPQEQVFFEKSSLWRKTPAVRGGRVVVIDGALLLRPGPRLAQGLERLAEALQLSKSDPRSR